MKRDLDKLQVGLVLRPHGKIGELRILATTDLPVERFRLGEELGLGEQKHRIESARPLSKENWLIKLSGIDDRTVARRFQGEPLWVERRAAEGGWLRDDLIGCLVLSRSGRKLGRVTEIEVAPSND